MSNIIESQVNPKKRGIWTIGFYNNLTVEMTQKSLCMSNTIYKQQTLELENKEIEVGTKSVYSMSISTFFVRDEAMPHFYFIQQKYQQVRYKRRANQKGGMTIAYLDLTQAKQCYNTEFKHPGFPGKRVSKEKNTVSGSDHCIFLSSPSSSSSRQ